jgi:hypothetical protein
MHRLEPCDRVSLILRDARKSALLRIRCLSVRSPDAAQRVSGALLIRGPLIAWGSRPCEAAPRALHRVRDTVSYSRSTIVTLAMPPPSHMVCRP